DGVARDRRVDREVAGDGERDVRRIDRADDRQALAVGQLEVHLRRERSERVDPVRRAVDGGGVGLPGQQRGRQRTRRGLRDRPGREEIELGRGQVGVQRQVAGYVQRDLRAVR